MKSNDIYTVFVFSRNYDKELFYKEVNSVENNNLFFLTTYLVFEREREMFRAIFPNKNILFKCFDNFINDDEMQHCDEYAFKKFEGKNKLLFSQQHDYFSNINEIKNQIIFNNLKKNIRIKNGFVFSNDLGVKPNIWVSEGFINKCETKALEIKKVHNYSLIRKIFVRLRNEKKIISNITQSLKKISIFNIDGKKYLFLLSSERVINRLNISRENVNFIYKAIFPLLLDTIKLYISKRKIYKYVLNKCKTKYENLYLGATIHFFSQELSDLSLSENIKLYVFQDSFLPMNYSSKYISFFDNVNCFYVWDKLSIQYFKANNLFSNYFRLYKKTKFKTINNSKIYKIQTVVIIDSSAGDWVALKNRSDQDRMFELFLKVASLFPKIKFVYRPHPFCENPLHLGQNYIMRLIKNSENIKNFRISSNLVQASIAHNTSNSLYSNVYNFEKDISKGDVFFGEHSIGIVEAAKKNNKIFASVNPTYRRDLFANYSKLGAINLKTVDEVADFLTKIQSPNNKYISQYNSFVENYSKKYM